MPDIADARADRPLQPGDVVRVVGQDLLWTVLFHMPELRRGDGSTIRAGFMLWNDIHGRQEFPPEVLERVR